MTRLFLALALLAACDGDSFEAPDMPDRTKGPLDFSIPYTPDLIGAEALPPDLGSID